MTATGVPVIGPLPRPTSRCVTPIVNPLNIDTSMHVLHGRVDQYRVPTAQGKQGNRENDKKKSVRENTGNLEILPKHRENTGNLVCSSCKFPDPKSKKYFGICHENFHFFGGSGQVSFVYVIVMNHVNWHRENVWSDRENTGNSKTQFEWVPCSMHVLHGRVDQSLDDHLSYTPNVPLSLLLLSLRMLNSRILPLPGGRLDYHIELDPCTLFESKAYVVVYVVDVDVVCMDLYTD